MSTKPTAAASGAIGAAVDIGSRDVLPASGKLQQTGMGILDQYQAELEGLLSSNPSMRMEANAKTIADTQALAEGQRKQVANLPRGGESAYLSGQIDQNVATQIGNALSATFNQALAAEGALGQYETSTGLQGDIQTAGLDIQAGSAYDHLSQAVAAGDKATIDAITSAATSLFSFMLPAEG